MRLFNLVQSGGDSAIKAATVVSNKVLFVEFDFDYVSSTYNITGDRIIFRADSVTKSTCPDMVQKKSKGI
jgi:hypothetical protein